MSEKVSTRELGLILGARLMKTDDLHYGLWTEGLEVKLANLPQAQANYSDYLMARIPPGVRTVLDVGCGTGHVAQLLTERGYEVTCISPSPVLTRMARERLGDAVPVHQTTYEAFESAQRFDLVLFSESFQYIAPRDSLPKSLRLLTDNGHVLIADFFRTEASGASALQGGHSLAEFTSYLETLPLEVVFDQDITGQTAPNLQLMDELLQDYARPIWEAFGYYLRNNRPWIARVGRWLFRKRLEKIEFKYFSRERSAGGFAKHKSYRCYLLRKKPSSETAESANPSSREG